MPATPQVATDILDTFGAIRGRNVCPYTGWDYTICGTYQTIADAVNLYTGSTSYKTSDIGVGLTWLHENGPDMHGGLGQFICKAGPGKSNTHIVFDDPNKPDIDVVGNVYIRVTENQPLPKEKRRVIALSLLQWCTYRQSSIKNDNVDLRLLRQAYPASERRVRRVLQLVIDNNTDEQNAIQDLAAELERLVV